ncbi:MAG: hypothetical protein M3347_19150, partial [Armatimonadota bacterium]|nr:hypothetical protein [Armatimonadota bacterium]
MNREHVEYAAQQRTSEKSFAQVLVDLGWISREEILQIDPNAFEAAPAASTSPAATMPLPTAETPPGAGLPGQTAPPMSGAGYGAPVAGVSMRPAQVTFDHIGRAWG